MENREKSPKKQKIKLNTKSQHAAYFMPMLEGFAERDMLNEVIKNRVVKACDLLDAGVPLFPNDFRKEHAVSWVLDNFGSLSAEELEAKGDVFAIAGRIVSLRSFGKVAFFHIMDESGRIQCYASREELPEEVYNVVKKLDVGDIVGVSGHLFHTKTGELTISCQQPQAHHALHASPAGKVSRPQGHGDPLPPALCGPHRHRARPRDLPQAQHDRERASAASSKSAASWKWRLP